MLSEKLCAPLLLTTFDEEDFVLRALKSGINGYILKNSPAERIINAVRTVSTGGTVFQEDILFYIREKIVSGGKNGGREIFTILSPRETDIVRLIAMGFSIRKSRKNCLFPTALCAIISVRYLKKQVLNTERR